MCSFFFKGMSTFSPTWPFAGVQERSFCSIWLENVVPAHEGPLITTAPPISTCSSVEEQKHPVTALHVVSTEVHPQQDGSHSLCPVGGGQRVGKLVG